MIDGVSLRDHLLQSSQHDPAALEELALPPFPEELNLVWHKFLGVSSGRTMGFNGPNPISHADIYYWTKLTRWDVSAWEMEIIKRLDDAWMKSRRS